MCLRRLIKGFGRALDGLSVGIVLGLAFLLITGKIELTIRILPSSTKSSQEANLESMTKIFGDCKNPCVVKENWGGNLYDFLDAAKALKKSGRFAVIDGTCASGCEIFADWGRPQVCITEQAVFLFHKGYDRSIVEGEVLRFDPPQSRDILGWVVAHGDFPRDDRHMLGMFYNDAKKFWPTCDLNPPLPQADPRKIIAAAH